MPVEFDQARAFVESVDLGGTPRRSVRRGAAADAGTVFDTAKEQAQVVGSGLFSFAEGVTAEVRDAISNSALLAQLVANKRFSANEAPMEWYGEYVKVLQNVGWVLQDRQWTDYTTEGTAVEVHQKIIEVLSAALGPSMAALDIIRSAIDVLKNMTTGTSWFTIFNRESQHANIARFQIGLVETDENADVFVTLLACLIEAEASMTQVLLFKFRDEQASFKANSAKVSINSGVLEHVSPSIQQKVIAYSSDYVSSIKDL